MIEPPAKAVNFEGSTRRPNGRGRFSDCAMSVWLRGQAKMMGGARGRLLGWGLKVTRT
jgi:hypothetical protein